MYHPHAMRAIAPFLLYHIRILYCLWLSSQISVQLYRILYDNIYYKYLHKYPPQSGRTKLITRTNTVPSISIVPHPQTTRSPNLRSHSELLDFRPQEEAVPRQVSGQAQCRLRSAGPGHLRGGRPCAEWVSVARAIYCDIYEPNDSHHKQKTDT